MVRFHKYLTSSQKVLRVSRVMTRCSCSVPQMVCIHHGPDKDLFIYFCMKYSLNNLNQNLLTSPPQFTLWILCVYIVLNYPS